MACTLKPFTALIKWWVVFLFGGLKNKTASRVLLHLSQNPTRKIYSGSVFYYTLQGSRCGGGKLMCSNIQGQNKNAFRGFYFKHPESIVSDQFPFLRFVYACGH